MGATDKGIPFVESDDLIAGWPAADELQAETIDGLLGDNAQDLADFEATLDGGNAGQVLTKVSNADGAYDWMNPTGGGDGTPPDLNNLGSVVSGEADNQLQLSDNDGTQDPPLLYVPPTVELLGGATSPQHFAGKGRPDIPNSPDVHDPDEIAQLAAAPTGSTYTWTGDDPDAVFGARVWRKGVTDWVCIEGDTGWKAPAATIATPACTVHTGTGVGVRRIGEQLHVSFVLSAYNDTGKIWENTLKNPGIGWQPAGSAMSTTDASLISDPPGSAATGLLDGQVLFALSNDWPAFTGVTARAAGVFVPIDAEWPAAEPQWAAAAPARTVEELRELIEEIEAEGESHPQWDTLQQLREELAELTGTKPGDDK